MPFDPTTPRSRDEVLLQAIVSGDSSAMGEPRDREEEFVKAIADKETLPDYSEASEGDVLQIGTDGPEWGAVPNGLPAIAAGDAGKVLKVNSGETGVEWGSANATYYTHTITLYNKTSYTARKFRIYFSFVSTQSAAYTPQSLWNYLHEYGLAYGGGSSCFGWEVVSGSIYFITELSTSTANKYIFYERPSTDPAASTSNFEVTITNCEVGDVRIST